MPHNTPIPISTLLNMMSYRRPHESLCEQIFIHKFIDCLPGVKTDDFGNKFVVIGEKPSTLFSAHIDTVHRQGGPQIVNVDENTNTAFKDDGTCLGADDAAGMWVLQNLIAAGVPGLYVFHRGEERGLLGSTWIADNNPLFLIGIKRAIAFDRRANTSIITHQCSTRCCSEEFSAALSAQLNMGHVSDDTGSFTDTASYMEIIPECTNVSVGYLNEHSSRETQDLTYVQNLAHACINVDWSALPTARDHTKVEQNHNGFRSPRRAKAAKLPAPPKPASKPTSLLYPDLKEIDTDDDNDDADRDYLSYDEAVDFALRNPLAAAEFMIENFIRHQDVDDLAWMAANISKQSH